MKISFNVFCFVLCFFFNVNEGATLWNNVFSVRSSLYAACIRPILLYPFPAFCNIPQYLKRRIISVENRVFKIIGLSDNRHISLFSAADQMCVTLFNKVVADSTHPLRRFFDERRVLHLRNACPLKKPKTKTRRFLASFIQYCP